MSSRQMKEKALETHTLRKCKKSGVIRTNEDNNQLFLKGLGTEWLNVTMSMRTNLDVEFMSLAELYGTLASLEPQVSQLKSSIGGPLALVAEGGRGKCGRKMVEGKKNKKKALLMEEDDEEELSSEEEISMKEMMKTLVSFTRDFRRGTMGGSKGFDRRRDSERKESDRGSYGRRESSKGFDTEKGRDFDRESYERRDSERKDDQRVEEVRGEPQRTAEGCFRCGKPGHYAA